MFTFKSSYDNGKSWNTSTHEFDNQDDAAKGATAWLALNAVNGCFPAVTLAKVISNRQRDKLPFMERIAEPALTETH